MITEEQWAEIERDFESRYYLLGNVTPVRVLFNKKSGLKSGAIAPDNETGELVFRNTLMSRLEQSPEVEDIDRERFGALCREIYRTKQKRPPLPA